MAPWPGVVAALLAIIGLARLLRLAPRSRAILVLTLLCAVASCSTRTSGHWFNSRASSSHVVIRKV